MIKKRYDYGVELNMDSGEHSAGMSSVQTFPAVSQSIRTLIVGDSRLFVEAVVTALRHHDGINHAGLAGGPEEPVEKEWVSKDHAASEVDVVLIDAGMEWGNPAQLVEDFKKQNPRVKVVVLGVEEQEEDILDLIQAGVNAYVSKRDCLASLLRTIQSVHNGETPCSPKIAASVFGRVTALARLRVNQGPRTVALTAREKEILRLVRAGLDNQEIAHQFSTTAATVKGQVQNILCKLQKSYRRGGLWGGYGGGEDDRVRPILTSSDNTE